MEILGYNITCSLEKINFKRKTIINTINPHSYCVAKKDAAFQQALIESDFLLPDGIGIVIALKVLKGKKLKKIAGYDVFQHLIEQLNNNRGSCFFLGASEDTLYKISTRLENEYPDIKVGSYSPPYKPNFSQSDSQKMIEAVNSFQPDVLFVGMTAPKQEKWVFQYKEELDAKIICSIGAVFDFYAGTVKRPSQFWISAGLEWFPRFLKEPRRLAERNLVSTPKFILEVLKEKFKSIVN